MWRDSGWDCLSVVEPLSGTLFDPLSWGGAKEENLFTESTFN